MELGIRQIILLIIAVIVGTLIIIFIFSKLGADGSITQTTTGILDNAIKSLQ
ncbi:MAG: hypothetical protein QF460_02795 [Candidatus Nanoarchaeia archaeon]|jgi:uncharacterized membrane protein YvbJ|nr:hypothetical protein [Candidatus Nanoarchaeia archaeon]|tara:strand:- start:2263 stop:2418 length:156 start_codon:yes stop_codon:yes gene_type:complete